MKFERRKYQESLKDRIVKTFEETDNIILEAPPGWGKSAIAYLLHEEYYNKSIKHKTGILMHQKTLQDQYRDFFTDSLNTLIMKGKSNYKCLIDPKISVEEALCCQSKCLFEKTCEYFQLRKRVNSSPLLITNYHFILAALQSSWYERVCDLVVFDECHNLNSIFTESFTVRIDSEVYKVVKKQIGSLKPHKASNSMERITNSLKGIAKEIVSFNKISYERSFDNIFSLIKDIMKTIDEISKENKLPPLILKELMVIYTYYLNLCSSYNFYSINKKENEYIFDNRIDNEGKFVYELVPLSVDKIFMSIANKISQKKLFMSATITDVESYVKELGIKDYKYIRMPNIFPSKNRIVNFMNISKLNYQNVYREPLSNEMSNCYEAVLNICKMHGEYNESGVLFVPSYRLTEKIIEDLKNDIENLGFIIYYNLKSEDREKVLASFMDTKIKKRLLISPSFFEGVNFINDISRFQIIFKTPYLSLQSKAIKIKANKDRRWYETSSLRAIIQACGRSTRNKTDHSRTYILDKQSYSLHNRYSHLLDSSFLEGVKIW